MYKKGFLVLQSLKKKRAIKRPRRKKRFLFFSFSLITASNYNAMMLDSYIPLSQPPSPPPSSLSTSTAAALSPRPLSSLKVLLVDDNPINLQLLKRVLYTIFDIQHMDLANGGHQALQLLEHRLYDVILLDIDMPGMSGVETTQLIRTQHSSSSIPTILDANKTIPIVAVTTSDSLEARIMYQKVGMVIIKKTNKLRFFFFFFLPPCPFFSYRELPFILTLSLYCHIRMHVSVNQSYRAS